MGIKYYYSIPQQIRQALVLTDAVGNPIYVFENSKFIKNLPRVTICSILNGNTLSFGFTTCASKDTFKRKVGQKISRERALKKPYKTVVIEDMSDIHTISDAIVAEIYKMETSRLYD